MSDPGRVLVEGGPVHRRISHAMIALAGGVLGSFAAFGFAIHDVQHNAIVNCTQIEVVKHGLRETLEEAERFARSSPVRSREQRNEIATFYRDALGRLKPRSC